MTLKKIIPCLWFDDQGEAAAKFYTSVFKNSKMGKITRYPKGTPRPEGMALTISFELEGTEFVGLNGGPEFKFTEAVSFQVMCDSQEEVDYYWEKLSAGGIEQCGWLKDKFGLSWQIVPIAYMEMITNGEPKKIEKAMAAMMKMKKLDIAELQRAYDEG